MRQLQELQKESEEHLGQLKAQKKSSSQLQKTVLRMMMIKEMLPAGRTDHTGIGRGSIRQEGGGLVRDVVSWHQVGGGRPGD